MNGHTKSNTLSPETREKIEHLRAELHELYKREVKQTAKIDRIAAQIRKLREADDGNG